MPTRLPRSVLSTISDLRHWPRLIAAPDATDDDACFADIVVFEGALERELRWCLERLDEPDDRTLMFNMGGPAASNDIGTFSLTTSDELRDLRRYKSAFANLLENDEVFDALWQFLALYELHLSGADLYAVRSGGH